MTTSALNFHSAAEVPQKWILTDSPVVELPDEWVPYFFMSVAQLIICCLQASSSRRYRFNSYNNLSHPCFYRWHWEEGERDVIKSFSTVKSRKLFSQQGTDSIVFFKSFQKMY